MGPLASLLSYGKARKKGGPAERVGVLQMLPRAVSSSPCLMEVGGGRHNGVDLWDYRKHNSETAEETAASQAPWLIPSQETPADVELPGFQCFLHVPAVSGSGRRVITESSEQITGVRRGLGEGCSRQRKIV